MTRQDWGGKGAEVYPVKLGQVFQIDQHVLACGDLEAGHADVLLAKYAPDGQDISFTDPPWNLGIANAFRTQAADTHRADFTALMRSIARVLSRTKRDVVIEMGIDETPRVIAMMTETGAVCHDVGAATYKNKTLQLSVIHLTWGGATPALLPPELRHGWKSSAAYMDAICKPGDLVLDPCLGQGGTLKLAHARGALVLGMELNPKRLSSALTLAAKLTGQGPIHIGDL